MADSQVITAATPLELPPAERAGRVPFVELYGSLRSSTTQGHIAYLHSVQALADGPARRAALTAFFQCMASIDPQKAVDLLRQQVGKDDLQRTVLAVLAATSAVDTPVLVKMLLDLPDLDPKWREEKLKSQMFFWAALDPTAAARFADEYQSVYPDLAANGIVQCLTAADPAAGERWLKEHPELAKQPEIMSNYLRGLFQDDPAKARHYLIEHAMEEAVQPSLKGVARFTFLSSADDAAEFISHLPTKETRQAALDGILDINTEIFATGETSQTALCAGLAEWITKFSPDDWPTSVSQFLGQWRELDFDGSVSWMARLPPLTRSAIAGQFVRDLPIDQLKQVLTTATAGDFHHDVLNAFAERLSKLPGDRHEAVIQALELPPEDAAQLAALVR